MPDSWDPEVYERFKAERTQPFDDLLALVDPAPGGAAVDLGCGTGELTRRLHEHLGAATTLGVDSSAEMLGRSEAFAGGGVSFSRADIGTFVGPDGFDVVLANAALHWVPDHRDVLARWVASLRPGGQLAVQVPANADHASHLLVAEVAAEEPFASALVAPLRPDPVAMNVLRPEEYALVVHDLGATRQHVRLQVYAHMLPSTAAVADWTAGTTLTRVRDVLPDELWDAYLERYRSRLVEVLGERSPFLYPFKRILLRARFG